MKPSVQTWLKKPSFAANAKRHAAIRDTGAGHVAPFITADRQMLPSVGTWFMKPSFATRARQGDSTKAIVDDADLSVCQDDKFSYMASELSLRQAAFDSFWAQVDEEEEEHKFSFMASELSLRRAAFDNFWAQLDAEEEEEKFSHMASELSLRQAAFDMFWAELDAHKQLARMPSESITSPPRDAVCGAVQMPTVRKTYIMAGSPAKSIRRAKDWMPFCPEQAPVSLLSFEALTLGCKNSQTTKRASSTSAMKLDLCDRKADAFRIDLPPAPRTKHCSPNKVQWYKETSKKLVLPSLKKSSSSSNLLPADFPISIQKPRLKFAQGC